MAEIRPLGDQVLIRPSGKGAGRGGIILPDSVEESPGEGEVVAVAPDANRKLQPASLLAGDRVLFNCGGGIKVLGDPEGLVLVSADDLLGILVRRG